MTYIIGEIGQNHNGSVGMAKAIIDLACLEVKDEAFGDFLPALDAVKLTKRDLSQELTESAMNANYDSLHSFGKTYGEHRKALELDDHEHHELFDYAKSKGLDFVETLCAPGCTSLLKLFTPDFLKVASRDLTNQPLLEVLGETKIPIIVSTGMAGEVELNGALDVLNRYHEDISILHCVSEYPTRPANVNLNTIKWLQKNYPNYVVGYSDHTIGISTPVAAVAMGAQIIEKHITLDRRLKGTDQAGSLGPDGLRRMIRDIRILEQSLGREGIFLEEAVKMAKEKLERSIAVNRDMSSGEVISKDDLHMLSPGTGLSWNALDEVVGKTLARDLGRDELVQKNLLK